MAKEDYGSEVIKIFGQALLKIHKLPKGKTAIAPWYAKLAINDAYKLGIKYEEEEVKP